MCGNEPCRHENADAITSFVTQTKALVNCEAERDAALATLARVEALCDSRFRLGQAGWLIDDLRAALAATP